MNDSETRQDFRWVEFRKNRFLFFFLWLAWIPIAYLLVVLLNLFLPENAVTVGMLIVFFVYGVFLLKAYWSYKGFLCPQCGKRFLHKEGSIWTRLGATRCMNCGVRVPKKTGKQ